MWKIMCNTETEAKTKDWGYSFSVSFRGCCWWTLWSWCLVYWVQHNCHMVTQNFLAIPGCCCVGLGLGLEQGESLKRRFITSQDCTYSTVWLRLWEFKVRCLYSALLSVVWYIIATKSPQLSSKHSHNRPGASYIWVVRPCSFSTKLKTYTSEKRKFRKGGEGKMANQAHWQRWRTSSWPYLCTV